MTVTRLLPAILAMAALVVASNILVQFILGSWLTWGALTYPFTFLITDLTNRFYGAQSARRVVLIGFFIGVLCSFVAAIFGVATLRIAIASGAAFLCAQLFNVMVFDLLRRRVWWQAPLASSVLGSLLDTFLFFTIAFSLMFPVDINTAWSNELTPVLGAGPVAYFWVSLALADWLMKLLLGAVALAPFRLALDWHKDRFSARKGY